METRSRHPLRFEALPDRPSWLVFRKLLPKAKLGSFPSRPRWKQDAAVVRVRYTGVLPKAVERLHRPSLHVAASWALGAAIQFYVANEDLLKDPQTQMEIVVLVVAADSLR